MSEITYISVPFSDYPTVEALGAHWDAERLAFYLMADQSRGPFAHWLVDDGGPAGGAVDGQMEVPALMGIPQFSIPSDQTTVGNQIGGSPLGDLPLNQPSAFPLFESSESMHAMAPYAPANVGIPVGQFSSGGRSNGNGGTSNFSPSFGSTMSYSEYLAAGETAEVDPAPSVFSLVMMGGSLGDSFDDDEDESWMDPAPSAPVAFDAPVVLDVPNQSLAEALAEIPMLSVVPPMPVRQSEPEPIAVLPPMPVLTVLPTHVPAVPPESTQPVEAPPEAAESVPPLPAFAPLAEVIPVPVAAAPERPSVAPVVDVPAVSVPMSTPQPGPGAAETTPQADFRFETHEEPAVEAFSFETQRPTVESDSHAAKNVDHQGWSSQPAPTRSVFPPPVVLQKQAPAPVLASTPTLPEMPMPMPLPLTRLEQPSGLSLMPPPLGNVASPLLSTPSMPSVPLAEPAHNRCSHQPADVPGRGADVASWSDGDHLAVSVLGMKKRCYRCSVESQVVVGILLGGSAEEESKPTKWVRDSNRDGDGSPSRFIPLPIVVIPLAAILDAAWYEEHKVGALKYREVEGQYRLADQDGGWSNGCSSCDVMFRDPPIQDAFEEVAGVYRVYDDYVLGVVKFPVADLPAENMPLPGDPAYAASRASMAAAHINGDEFANF